MTSLSSRSGDGRSFERMAAIAAVVSAPIAAANIVTMFAAVHFEVTAMSHPLLLIRQGATGATLWRWSMVFDTLGYYLLIVPGVLVLRSRLRRADPNWTDLSTLCLLAYCLVGAIGAAILATAIPPLINGYAASGSHRVVLETVFNGYSNAIYRGMWNLLEEFLAGIGWIGMGLVLRREHSRLGRTTVLLGTACLVDSLGVALNTDALAMAGLTVYLVIAPLWAVWLGVHLLRHTNATSYVDRARIATSLPA